MYTRRSTRARHPPITFSPQIRSTITAARTARTAQISQDKEVKLSYTLNKNKAINKKSKAATRQHTCSIETKKGGNIVINLSTAAYEIVKGAMLLHYSQQFPEKSEIKEKKEEGNAIVEHTISLYGDNSKNKKSKLYTINLYHTKSKILTNGQHPNICIDHIQQILSLVNEEEIKELNELILAKCREVSINQAKDQSTRSTTSDCQILTSSLQTPLATDLPESIFQENIENRHTDPEDIITTVICPHCNQSSDDCSIECSQCSQWVHIRCEGLDNGTAEEYEDNLSHNYTCKICAVLNKSIHGQTENAQNDESTTPKTTSLPHNNLVQVIIEGDSPVETTKRNYRRALTEELIEPRPATARRPDPNIMNIRQTTTSKTTTLQPETVHKNRNETVNTNKHETVNTNRHETVNTNRHGPKTNTTQKQGNSSAVGNSHSLETDIPLGKSKEQPQPPQNTQMSLSNTNYTHCNTNSTSEVRNSHSQQTVTATTPKTTEVRPQATCNSPRSSDNTNQEKTILPATKTTMKRQKKKETFQLTDLEKQLAFCKSEIIRLESCCKEYQNTIQILKLRLLTSFVNKTIEFGSLPQHLKEGILTPVLKKGKDQKIPTNYRGITVTTVFSKILEHCLQIRLNMQLEPTQSKLQRGFTAKTSPLNAAFLVSEAIAENKDLNNPMGLITLDAEKAFDRVWHERLFQKLYNDGIQGKLWLLLRDLQANGSTKVKWDRNLSNQFQTMQGIRQGAKLSTTLYKRYNNPLLKQIEEHELGTNIGTTNVGAPTVADDISMLPSNPVDAQIMLHTVYNNAKQDKVRFNASKKKGKRSPA